MAPKSQIGRELKVSELEEDRVVVVWKEGRPAAITVWVAEVTPGLVFLLAGDISTTLVLLVLMRCGPDSEQVQDEDRVPMKIFEYLWEL